MGLNGEDIGFANTLGPLIRQDYFQIGSVCHKVSLGQNYISWEPEGAPDSGHLVRLSEVVGVSRPHASRPASGSGSRYRLPVRADGAAPAPAAAGSDTCGRALALHYAERRGRRWRLRHQHLHQRNPTTLQLWADQLESLIKGFRRPRNLMVFINPKCGARRAPGIYKKKVKPIFDLGGIKAEVVQTTHAGHAAALLQQCSLSGCDGLVVVGGDGTLMEVLNGLLRRQPSEQPAVADIPIGVIPDQLWWTLWGALCNVLWCVPAAGSTDAVCGSLQGNQDVVTAALHIVMGFTRWADVCSVNTGGKLLRYSLSMITYGFFGDLLKSSEKLLWLGPMRYNVAGVGRFWRSHAYRGSVAFRTTTSPLPPPKPCLADCDVCLREPPSAGAGQQTDAAGEWQRVAGPFLVVSSANVSCRCKITPEGMCPTAHLSDGWAHLILVKKTSRVNFLRYMYRSASGKDPLELPFVEYYRVKEFEMLPDVTSSQQRLLWETHVNSALSVDSAAAGDADPEAEVAAAGDEKHSVWNCDGEVVSEPRVHLKVHPCAVRLFGRGVERVDETSCCCTCTRRAKKHI